MYTKPIKPVTLEEIEKIVRELNDKAKKKKQLIFGVSNGCGGMDLVYSKALRDE